MKYKTPADLLARGVRQPNGCIFIGNPENKARYWTVNTGGGRLMDAHRLMYMLVNGPIPSGKNVCHSCDNTRCINPDHLWLGTQLDNMRDCANNGRRNPLRGERHPFSIITDAQRREIIEKHERGIAYRQLSKQYPITAQGIAKLCYRHRKAQRDHALAALSHQSA